MTVAELIKRLQRCDPDAFVVFMANSEEEYSVDCVAEIRNIANEKNDDYIRVELR